MINEQLVVDIHKEIEVVPSKNNSTPVRNETENKVVPNLPQNKFENTVTENNKPVKS